MKQCSKILVSVIICVFVHHFVRAQSINKSIKSKVIEPYPISISETKTTNVIFPYSIISVDRGSSEILVQKANGVENILQLKAAQPGIAETNVTVITNDGQFYSFLVSYSSDPKTFNIQVFKDSTAEKHSMMLSGFVLNQAEVNNITKQVETHKRFLHIYTREQKIKFQLKGIYLKENIMWFSSRLKNSSLIDYKPESIRFFAKDLRRVKRSAVQENEVVPLYVRLDSLVAGKTAGNFVFGFKPFTIPKTQQLFIVVSEDNGGRSLILHCSYKLLLQTRRLE